MGISSVYQCTSDSVHLSVCTDLLCRSTPGIHWALSQSAAVASAWGTHSCSPLALSLWQIHCGHICHFVYISLVIAIKWDSKYSINIQNIEAKKKGILCWNDDCNCPQTDRRHTLRVHPAPGWAWRRSRWWWGGCSTSSSRHCPPHHYSAKEKTGTNTETQTNVLLLII